MPAGDDRPSSRPARLAFREYNNCSGVRVRFVGRHYNVCRAMNFAGNKCARFAKVVTTGHRPRQVNGYLLIDLRVQYAPPGAGAAGPGAGPSWGWARGEGTSSTTVYKFVALDSRLQRLQTVL